VTLFVFRKRLFLSPILKKIRACNAAFERVDLIAMREVPVIAPALDVDSRYSLLARPPHSTSVSKQEVSIHSFPNQIGETSRRTQMFKNYLTYQFALSFHQLCLLADIAEAPKKNLLLRSAEQMIQSFTRSLHAKAPAEEGRHYFSALLNLRECRDELIDSGLFYGEIEGKYRIVHDRLEGLCEKAATSENGQFRMLG
jgi:hypothetical protein